MTRTKTKFQRVKALIEAFLSVRDTELRTKRVADLRQYLNEAGFDKVEGISTDAMMDAVLAKLGLTDTPSQLAVMQMMDAGAMLDTTFIQLQATFAQIRDDRPMGMGRTTRQLLLCLEMMSGPQTVNYLWPEQGTLYYPLRLMVHIVQQIGMPFSVHERPDRRKELVLTNVGSRIVFLPVQSLPSKLLAGRGPSESWVLDHACEILHPEFARPWLEELNWLPDRSRPY